jgi:peptidoglycan/xylan/chitin deacetylase (PgdA/CDA1 family)
MKFRLNPFLKSVGAPLVYPLLRASRMASGLFSGGRCQKRLRVLLYHDIAPEAESHFEVQLRWLRQNWCFVEPEQFVAMACGDAPILEDSLLLTFDDGFVTNRRVAERILNPLGIRAIFFVVSEFVALNEGDDWRGFVSQNIHPGLGPQTFPPHLRNMNWTDMEYLVETGHTIGGHTAHHARLSQVSADALGAEIIESANALERRLGIGIKHFAYTFGDLASFSPDALDVARSRFPYVYTGLRGDNAGRVPPWAIRRDALSPSDSLSLAGAFLEGGADWRYSRSLATYESWDSLCAG